MYIHPFIALYIIQVRFYSCDGYIGIHGHEYLALYRVLLSVRVEFAGSKIAITTANFGGLKNNLYPIAALKLGFMMICAISPYSIPVKS